MQDRSRIHFVGIGGYGMSSLAKIFLEMGWDVSGSDLKDSRRLRELQGLGARVAIGHDAANLDRPDLVVVSVAVPGDNVEVIEAKRLGIPVISRAELLGRLMGERYSIAVTGSHGKTTTTSMISAVLTVAGLDPTIVI
ncbi:MAG TPA: UDP-N-acetylmuramate--L-alanine ligase, partial [Firmicutes bacterium]|nr:UDP-N-acetylmuramate--L-alanine ligase [Bacillota bacterium]